ncbi:uncharacterized protein LOC107265582 [Cephus cinctus]|uniref:Uncharacterized protein LOC107265582 n=1 Tax=Cephus cinctus TaxID=211228 RepID=A0AAJ7BPV3_CEPCN|nr:uncharacterized protein LOC107265582 [Cephus cinctus]
MTRLARLLTFIPEGQRCSHYVNTFTILRMSSNVDEGSKNKTNKLSNDKTTETEKKYKQRTNEEIDELVAPNNCCMSGCANCVWIQYAEKLSNVLRTSDADVQKIIMDKVEDPNMRVFLSMELHNRKMSDK